MWMPTNVKMLVHRNASKYFKWGRRSVGCIAVEVSSPSQSRTLMIKSAFKACGHSWSFSCILICVVRLEHASTLLKAFSFQWCQQCWSCSDSRCYWTRVTGLLYQAQTLHTTPTPPPERTQYRKLHSSNIYIYSYHSRSFPRKCTQ